MFSSTDLSPTTGSSGWLSFSRPLSPTHAVHIGPVRDSMDRRVEVVCARSGCHLGHYFGPTEGYCINASALRFVPTNGRASRGASGESTAAPTDQHLLPVGSRPVSWRPLDGDDAFAGGGGDDDGSHRWQSRLPPSHRVLKTVLETHGSFEEVALGCGCFWHVEDALRRLPGVRSTKACYAGGHATSPSYEDVCRGTTGHAEVVSLWYDPGVCPSGVLFDCFLAMHDPTKVRAHGKHALETGQYRSCIFVDGPETERVARNRLEECSRQLGKELSTELRLMGGRKQQLATTDAGTSEPFGNGWCWRAEDRHQRHDERRRKGSKNSSSRGDGGANGAASSPKILTAIEWLNEYGRRTPSITGSSSSIESSIHPDDDGMAMMMI